jgi:4-hydroxythreonine-4-phosphate dehydrogenase
LRVALATVHLPLSAVPGALSADRIADVAGLLGDSLRRDFAVQNPRIGVVALNPHAGESGLLGGEERDVIAPGVEEARRRLGDRASVAGPLVPDAAFRDARDGAYDALVAMYHDQALIPVKLLDFERAVNVTLGLPIARTSPDHGVAYDIAGSGRARPDSFAAALALAVKLADRRADATPAMSASVRDPDTTADA